ncbi:NAD(P)H-hydrate dehydratase [Maribacter sp. CXY002]|uniref:NAD(P)H-hydrate dehydratase n=1 Tax=Maribacter luteocoastalis TaxID=3407671 RepID=UPI003B6854C5
MKIFSAKQIYAADKITIKRQQITSDELMERAAVQIFNWLHLRLQGAPVKIHLLCGIGNNGGDGLALARHLTEHGYDIAVYIVNYSDKRSQDFLINLDRLKDRKVWPIFLDSASDLPIIANEDIIVDAIFGIGLNRTPDDWVKKLITHINTSEAFILSVDIPSGLFTDKVPDDKVAVVQSNYVLSFQTPKLIFFLPETGGYAEHWEVLDIGLDRQFLLETETNFELIGKNEVLAMYMPRAKYSHKGTFGHALIIGGSYGKIGAVNLASRAALKSGAGLVTAYIPKCGYESMQSSIPEVMVLTSEQNVIANIQFDIEPNVLGVGMGMGAQIETLSALTNLLENNKLPMVIDADGLNMLSSEKELLARLPKTCVLTPHPKELARLIGSWKDDFDKLRKVKQFSSKYDCIVVIKGAHTITVYKEKGYVNTTGNPGMATAGSGDVLAGMITGLIAQGYSALTAAIFGVYLHGKSGDIEIEKHGFQALLASDIVNGIGAAYLDLFKAPEQQQPQTEEEQP